jgi:hypothetical protein
MMSCAFSQLELLNMGKTGELKSIWQSASNTNVQFNLVRDGLLCWSSRHLATNFCKCSQSWRVHSGDDLTTPSRYGMLQVTFCLCSLLLTCLALTYVLTRAKPVYLRDFHVFKPPDECVQADDSTLMHVASVPLCYIAFLFQYAMHINLRTGLLCAG